MSAFNDDRFKHIITDPKFRNVPRKNKKVTIDKRFQSMFTDKKFQLKYSVDKRGRPIQHSHIEDYRNYYDLSSEEESDDSIVKSHSEDNTEESNAKFTSSDEGINNAKDKPNDKRESQSEEENDNEEVEEQEELEKGNAFEKEKAGLMKMEKKRILRMENKILDEYERSKISDRVRDRLQDMTVDYARGNGVLISDSSSDELSTDDSEEEIDHNWGEIDKDAEKTEEATKRIAVCHMDWDRVTAQDIMVLFHSFIPPTGLIKSVTIYPSEFGLERMKEEEVKGPQELVTKTLHSSDDEELDEKYQTEKLRQYQLKRLKYYYAVVVFDSVDAANRVYTECDGMEYESSATKLDLRFIPDDMTFEQEPREECTSLPDGRKYKPRLFANSALRQGKVELTWDETDPDRVEISKKIAAGDVEDEEVKAFIATSSEESDTDGRNGNSKETVKEQKEEKKSKNTDDIEKYRTLIADIQKAEEKKKKGDVELEISWDLGLQEKTQELEDKHKKDKLTPFEKLIEKKKERRKERFKKKKDDDNLFSDDELPSDIDMSDPYFKEEIVGKNRKKKGKKIQEKPLDGEEEQRKAELELLLANDAEEEKNKQHFSLKNIQESDTMNKKKQKWKRKKKQEVQQNEDNFMIDLQDNRFGALFTSHLYNIDPADPHFRKTKAMDDIVNEKSKRRRKEYNEDPILDLESHHSINVLQNNEITNLINSVKKKAKEKKKLH